MRPIFLFLLVLLSGRALWALETVAGKGLSAQVQITLENPDDFRSALLTRLPAGASIQNLKNRNGEIVAKIQFQDAAGLRAFLNALEAVSIEERLEQSPDGSHSELEISARAAGIIWPDFQSAFLTLLNFLLRSLYVLIWLFPLWALLAIFFWKRKAMYQDLRQYLQALKDIFRTGSDQGS